MITSIRMNQPDPKPESAELRAAVLQHYQRHVNSGVAKLAKASKLPLEVRSEGCFVFDETGEAYLDCGGYSVFLLGHRHPEVVDAVKAQLDRHPLATHFLLSAELGRASASLAACAPSGLDFVFFTNSGAEAVETGIKVARLSGKTRIISSTGGFHGKTIGALSVTGRPHYREPFHPLLPDIEFVPYGDAEAIGHALATEGENCCVILEPVQGENGVVIPPEGYLREVRRLCDLNGAFLMLDEIQTGLGRLGVWWGADREQVIPDILLAGKTLGGGVMPVGAMVTSAQTFAKLNRDPFLHSSTFAGNPLAMVAAEAAISAIRRGDIVTRARILGEKILAEVTQIFNDACPNLIAEVRGVGLLLGIEFRQEHVAWDFIRELLRKKVIAANSLNAFTVARLTPPAVMTDAECRWLFDAVRDSARTLKQRYDGA
jgi:putrescine aminotransferase